MVVKLYCFITLTIMGLLFSSFFGYLIIHDIILLLEDIKGDEQDTL